MTQNDLVPMQPIHQLRIYEISEEKKTIFHNRFKNHAMRIMKQYGFEILAMWESNSLSKLEFIYILKWPDGDTMEQQWKLFLADDEWIEIKKKTAAETGEPVLKVTSRVLEPVGYSPPFNLF